MNVYTNINPASKPFDPSAGSKRLQSPPPQQYGNAAVQQAYNDVYTPAAQQASVEFGRANSQAAADYRQRATAGQNRSVLDSLSLLNTQQQNANQRDQAMQKMAYGWMGDMFGGMGNVLGGLL